MEPMQKTVITREEWENKPKDARIWTKDMNKLVMNLLLTEDMDLKTVEDCKALMETVLSGQIEDAIKIINKWKPQLLGINRQLDFHLQQQMLREIIRCGTKQEALEFAQKLAPRILENPSIGKEFEKTMTMMANKGVKPGHYEELLDVSQRAKTAKEMDVAIFSSEDHDEDSLLASLLTMLIWVQNQLDEKSTYPHIINLQTASLEDSAI